MSPLTLKDIPTVSQSYAQGKFKAAAANTTTHAASASINDRISVLKSDITKLQVDAIVNAANSSLLGGGGVDGAIHAAAGPELVEECETLDGCDTGDAKMTKGYELFAKHVIHTVGPVYKRLKEERANELLQSCYRRSLETASQAGLRSVAFPAISTGVYGYPSQHAAQAALEEVRGYLEDGRGEDLERVVFCVFTEKDVEAYNDWVPRILPPAEETAAATDAQASI